MSSTFRHSLESREHLESSIVPNAWLWAIFLLGVILRFVFLSRESLWLDEAASVDIVRRSWSDFLRVLWHGEANMTTFYVALHPILLHVGKSEFWVRFPAVVAGIVTIPVMFRLGEVFFDSRIAMAAALLTSVSACHVSYSREARAYSMAVLFSALSILWFVRSVQGGSGRSWLVYVLMSVLAIYSHFYAGLVVVAELLSLFALPARTIPWSRLGVSLAAIGGMISPLLVVMLKHNVGQLSWVQKLSWLEVYHTAVFFAADEGKVLGNILLAFSMFALGNAARKTWKIFRDGRQVERWYCSLLWLWLMAPIGLVAILSLHTPVFFHRFFIVCLPAFLLLVGWGLSGFRHSAALIGLFAVLSIGTVAQHYGRTRENWRGATSYVFDHAQPGDAVLFFHRYSLGPFSYYQSLQNRNPLPEIREEELDHPSPYRRLWLVLYPVGPSDPLVDATSVRLKENYPVVSDTKFRRVQVLLLDVGGTGATKPN